MSYHIPDTSVFLCHSGIQQCFHYINNFKPLIDAYQGPYKDAHYYWSRVQLLIGMIFLGLSTLEKSSYLYLVIGTIIIAVMYVVTGMTYPLGYTTTMN